jgi:hypothetical protein
VPCVSDILLLPHLERLQWVDTCHSFADKCSHGIAGPHRIGAKVAHSVAL